MLNDIRETCLETLENTYASRLEILVDGGKFDDAKSIDELHSIVKGPLFFFFGQPC